MDWTGDDDAVRRRGRPTTLIQPPERLLRSVSLIPYIDSSLPSVQYDPVTITCPKSVHMIDTASSPCSSPAPFSCAALPRRLDTAAERPGERATRRGPRRRGSSTEGSIPRASGTARRPSLAAASQPNSIARPRPPAGLPAVCSTDEKTVGYMRARGERGEETTSGLETARSRPCSIVQCHDPVQSSAVYAPDRCSIE